MRRSLALSLALLALLESGATYASGVNLRWGHCLADGGPQNFDFACGSNSTLHRMVGSFVTASNVSHVRGFEIVVDIATASAELPAWWEFRNMGACRLNSLHIEAVPPEPTVNCPQWSGGSAVAGGISAYQIGLRGPNTARVLAHATVPVNATQTLFAGPEYFGFILGIDSQQTVGASACAGCAVPACIVLSSVTLVIDPSGATQRLTGPANMTDSDFVTWQGGSAGGVIGCPAATATRGSTWGAVKSLYR